ncbi:hypothetical protein BJF78_29360 [Pseudonocardia sp. CNS-139]|nr:hypothetical protein BJF78_29360 [Pseudonocardia sp. CNS-139]
MERFAAGRRRHRRAPGTVPADIAIPAPATAAGLDAIRARRPPAPVGRPRYAAGAAGSHLSDLWHWADQRTEGHTR